MKQYPIEFQSRREIVFYPAAPERLHGDILEIGPGRGDFLLSLAESLPDKQVVAIEMGKWRYSKLIPRIEKQGITNITLANGNAGIIVPRLIPDAVFEKVYILFPDPWPKRRHIPHRLLSVSFIAEIARIMKPDGNLYLATDFQPYAEWITKQVRQVPALSSLGTPHYTTVDAIDYYKTTVFEEKWRGMGRTIFYMRYRKTA